MQGTARSSSGLRARTGVVDLGSTVAVVGLDGDGGGSCSGLLWTQRHRRVKARASARSHGAQGADHWSGEAQG